MKRQGLDGKGASARSGLEKENLDSLKPCNTSSVLAFQATLLRSENELEAKDALLESYDSSEGQLQEWHNKNP
jgi:hypothetical protein